MSHNKNKNKGKVSKVIVVTSGKGGVGKTTTSASLALGLAMEGRKTVVIDFDIGLRNLDLIMGVERRVVYDFVNVINKEASLNQALIKHKSNPNLYVLAASQNKDKDVLTTAGVKQVLDDLRSMGFEYIVCDSPAGIEAGAKHAMYFADEAIVVVNPEIASIRDSDRIIGLLNSDTLKVKNGESIKSSLLITKFDEKRSKNDQMMKVTDIKELLSLDVIGVISDSDDIIEASNIGSPVISMVDKKSIPAKEYHDAVLRILGNDVPFTSTKKGFFGKLKDIIGGE